MAANRRWIALGVVALIVGIAIGLNDSRPTWDDTGVTAGLLVVAGAVFGFLDPPRWWIWALLIGVGTPLFEIGGPTGSGSLAAFVFSAVGAAGGATASRALRRDRRRRTTLDATSTDEPTEARLSSDEPLG
jgi:hypothetical protein